MTDKAASSTWRQRLGLAAERHAAEMLRRHGFVILAERYRCRHGEIDLVVRDATTLVFVEVKARRGHGFGEPAEAVGWRKRRALARAARHYLRSHGPGLLQVRFDVVSVTVGTGQAKAEWIVDAFRPGS